MFNNKTLQYKKNIAATKILNFEEENSAVTTANLHKDMLCTYYSVLNLMSINPF